MSTTVGRHEVGPVGPQDLPGHGAHPLAPGAERVGEERLEVVGGEDHVGVQDEDPLGSPLDGLADPDVVASGEAEVLARGDDLHRHRRELLRRGEGRAGAVLGPVVDGDELEVPVRLGEEGGQEALGVAGLVVRDEGDEDARHSGPPRQERARKPRPRRPFRTRR